MDNFDGIRDGLRLDFFTQSSFWKSCPHVYYQRINRDFASLKWKSIKDFIIDAIDMNYYVYLDIDRFYVPGSKLYKKANKTHDIFVYGYDLKENIFNFTEFLKNNVYTYSTIPIPEFENGYNGMLRIMSENKKKIGNANGLEMISYRKYKLDYKFDLILLHDMLKDYLNGENSYKKFRSANSQWNIDCNFGIKIYENFIKYLNSILIKDSEIDFRMFHLLWDHKRVMLSRIEFLGKNNYLQKSEDIKDLYLPIEKLALENRNILLKYYLTKDKNIIEKMISNIIWILNEEKNVIQMMIDNLNYKDFSFNS